MYEADTMETQEACYSGESNGNTETATAFDGAEVGGGGSEVVVLGTHAHHQQLDGGLDFSHHACKLESDTDSLSPCLSTNVTDDKIAHSLYSDAVVVSVNSDSALMFPDNYSSSSEPGGAAMEPACVSVCTDTAVKSTVLFTSPSTSVFSPELVQDKMNVIPSSLVEGAEQDSPMGQPVSVDHISREDKRTSISSHPVVIGNAGAASFVQSVLKDLKVEPASQLPPQPVAILLGQSAVLPGLVSLMPSVSGSVPAPVLIQFPQSLFSSLSTQPTAQAMQMETNTAVPVTTLPDRSTSSDSVSGQTPGIQSSVISVSGVEGLAELPGIIAASSLPAENVTSCAAHDSLQDDSMSGDDKGKPEQETCPQEELTAKASVRPGERAVVISCIKPGGQRGKGMQQMIDHFMQQNTGICSSKPPQSLEVPVMDLNNEENREQQSDSVTAGETNQGQPLGEACCKFEERNEPPFTDRDPHTGSESSMEVTPDLNVSSQMTDVPLQLHSHPLVSSQAVLQGNGFYPAWTGTQFPNSPVVLFVKDTDHPHNGAATLTSLPNLEMSDFNGFQEVGQDFSEETPHDEVDGTSRTSLHSRQSFIHVLSSVALEAEQLRAKEAAQQQCLTVQQICSVTQVQQPVNSLTSSIQPSTQLGGGRFRAESVIVTQNTAAKDRSSAIPDGRPMVVRVQFPVAEQQPSLAGERPSSTQKTVSNSNTRPSVAPELLSAAELHLATRLSENESSLQKLQNPDGNHSSDNTLAINTVTGDVQDQSSINGQQMGTKQYIQNGPEDVSSSKVVRPIILLVVQEDGSTRDVPINPVGSTVQENRQISTNFAISAASAVQSDEDVANTSPPSAASTQSSNTTDTSPVVTSKDETKGNTSIDSRSSSSAMDVGSKSGMTKCRRYSCDLCTATFSCLGNYTRHRKIHTLNPKDRSHKCSHCGRTFLQRCDMLRHVLIHTKEEPFRCKTCGKGYIRKSDLVVHERFHSKIRAFKCDECSSSFYQSGDLRRHKRTVHALQSQLTCDHCHRKYAKEVTLIRHMKTCHNDLLQSVSQATQMGQ